jgi:hypothetical protein
MLIYYLVACLPQKKSTYGNIARLNGFEFENKLSAFININEDIKKYLVNKISRYLNVNIELNKVILTKIPNKKVKSIHSKLTTPKADIWLEVYQQKIPISVKMSNKGTQLQIISIEIFEKYFTYIGKTIPSDVVITLKKFCGLIPPTLEELK